MKKLPIYEESACEEMRPLKIAVRGADDEPVPAAYNWDELFDHDTCLSWFPAYRDAIAKIGDAAIGHEELARMFLLGCQCASSVWKGDKKEGHGL